MSLISTGSISLDSTFKQARHIIPLKGMKSLYLALVHSHLKHGTLLMNSITTKNKQRIFKIQKKAIRIITGSTYNAHTTPLFLQHNILPYEKLITLSQLMFMPLRPLLESLNKNLMEIIRTLSEWFLHQ